MMAADRTKRGTIALGGFRALVSIVLPRWGARSGTTATLAATTGATPAARTRASPPTRPDQSPPHPLPRAGRLVEAPPHPSPLTFGNRTKQSFSDLRLHPPRGRQLRLTALARACTDRATPRARARRPRAGSSWRPVLIIVRPSCHCPRVPSAGPSLIPHCGPPHTDAGSPRRLGRARSLDRNQDEESGARVHCRAGSTTGTQGVSSARPSTVLTPRPATRWRARPATRLRRGSSVRR